jgi:hypothetical protein
MSAGRPKLPKSEHRVTIHPTVTRQTKEKLDSLKGNKGIGHVIDELVRKVKPC